MSVHCTAYMPKIEAKASCLDSSSFSFSFSFSYCFSYCFPFSFPFCKGSWERKAQTQTYKLEIHKVTSLGSYCWKPIPKEQPVLRSWLWSLHPNVLRFFHPLSEVKLKSQLSKPDCSSPSQVRTLTHPGHRRQENKPFCWNTGNIACLGPMKNLLMHCDLLLRWACLRTFWEWSVLVQASSTPRGISFHIVPLEGLRAQQLACFWAVWEVHAQAAEGKLITAWARVLTA